MGPPPGVGRSGGCPALLVTPHLHTQTHSHTFQIFRSLGRRSSKSEPFAAKCRQRRATEESLACDLIVTRVYAKTRVATCSKRHCDDHFLLLSGLRLRSPGNTEQRARHP